MRRGLLGLLLLVSCATDPLREPLPEDHPASAAIPPAKTRPLTALGPEERAFPSRASSQPSGHEHHHGADPGGAASRPASQPADDDHAGHGAASRPAKDDHAGHGPASRPASQPKHEGHTP